MSTTLHRCIALLPALAALTLSAGSPAGTRERFVSLPASFTLKDSEEAFISPTIRSKQGNFSVSLGESAGGDPGFGGVEKGEEFDLTLYVYWHGGDPNAPAPPSIQARMATGKAGVSVTSLAKHRTVRFHGVVFDITTRKLDKSYGHGKSAFLVRAHRP